MDILTIGHTTLDTFVQIPKAHIHCRLDSRARELCLNYGDKIVVEGMQTLMGGNAANAAAGLARLGFKTGILTYLGQDEEGAKVIGKLGNWQIKKDWVVQSNEGKTDQSVILTFEGERTILADHSPFVYQLPKSLPQTKWIYLTSINKNFQSFHQEFLAWYRGVKGTVPLFAFNPGSHELKAGVAGNAEILKICQVLILNKEEAEGWVLARAQPAGGLSFLLQELHKLGPQIVVITDAQNGTFAFDGKDFYHQKVFSGKRVEMTGAGDAFSAGFLGAELSNQDLPTALKWGNALASSVIGQVGAVNGLLTKKELLDIISTQ